MKRIFTILMVILAITADSVAQNYYVYQSAGGVKIQIKRNKYENIEPRQQLNAEQRIVIPEQGMLKLFEPESQKFYTFETPCNDVLKKLLSQETSYKIEKISKTYMKYICQQVFGNKPIYMPYTTAGLYRDLLSNDGTSISDSLVLYGKENHATELYVYQYLGESWIKKGEENIKNDSIPVHERMLIEWNDSLKICTSAKLSLFDAKEEKLIYISETEWKSIGEILKSKKNKTVRLSGNKYIQLCKKIFGDSEIMQPETESLNAPAKEKPE